MKQICTALAVILIIALLPLSALAAGPNSFVISGSEAWTTAVDVTNPALVSRLEALVTGGQAVDAPPAQSTELVQITYTNTQNTTAEYTIAKDDEGEAVYLYAGEGVYRVNAQSFYDLASSIEGFYTYRAIPAAKLTETANAALVDSTYNFRKLDGIFYASQFEKQAVPTIRTTGSSLVLPEITPAPASVSVKVSDDGTLLFSGSLEEAKAYSNTADGAVLVQVEATFASDYCRGKTTYQYYLNNGAADITFSVEGASTYPGELVVLRAQGVPAGESVTATTSVGFTPKFYDDGEGGKIAMLPVSYLSSTGQHSIELSAAGQTERFTITANGKNFQVQHLTVSESTTQATIASQKANEEFDQKFLPLRWDDDATQHWQGRFIQPVPGSPRVTTQFGAIRYTNGSTQGSRHGGIDWACATGTPVSAANSGRVVYAGFLQLTGNTVLIEHGYGLKSWYYHMDTLNVQTGQMVTKGQTIGTVGTTGFSTGPHLHFSVSVNEVFVNPYTLITTDLVA